MEFILTECAAISEPPKPFNQIKHIINIMKPITNCYETISISLAQAEQNRINQWMNEMASDEYAK